MQSAYNAQLSAHAALVVLLQVRSRMESESGISFTEFTYQLLQGYDFVHLAREHRVRVQVRH
jgi:tyrosyl-tRNA synthetase